MKAICELLVVLVACAGVSMCSPTLGALGKHAYSFHDPDAAEVHGDKVDKASTVADADADAEADAMEFAHLVVTTVSPTPSSGTRLEDEVPLDSAKERNRFLVTLLMLESLHDKPFPVRGVADAKLKKQILADEDVMQEVLKLYETQQGKKFIKIPPKLLKKMKKKMKELLSE